MTAPTNPIQTFVIEVEQRTTRTYEVDATSPREAEDDYTDRGRLIHSEGHPEEVMQTRIKGLL